MTNPFAASLAMAIIWSLATSSWAQQASSRAVEPELQITVDSPLPRAERHLRHIRFSPDGSQIVADDDIGNVYLIDVKAGKQIGRFQPFPNYDSRKIETTDVATVEDVFFTRRGFIVAWQNGAIASLKFAKDQLTVDREIRAPKSDYAIVAISPDGTRMGLTSVAVDENYNVGTQFELLDLKKLRQIAVVRLAGQIGPMTWSPDGDELAFVVDNKIHFIDKRGRESRSSLTPELQVSSISFSQDGQDFLVGFSGDDTTISKYELTKRSVSKPTTTRLENTIGPVISFHLHPSGKTFLAKCYSTSICDFETLTTLDSITTERHNLSGAAYSPDGRWLALCGSDDKIDLVRLDRNNSEQAEDPQPESARKEDPEFKVRTWTSADGKFSTEAKLIKFNETEVTLLKSDGKTITVPIKVFSREDKNYLNEQVPDKK